MRNLLEKRLIRLLESSPIYPSHLFSKPYGKDVDVVLLLFMA